MAQAKKLNCENLLNELGQLCLPELGANDGGPGQLFSCTKKQVRKDMIGLLGQSSQKGYSTGNTSSAASLILGRPSFWSLVVRLPDSCDDSLTLESIRSSELMPNLQAPFQFSGPKACDAKGSLKSGTAPWWIPLASFSRSTPAVSWTNLSTCMTNEPIYTLQVRIILCSMRLCSSTC